MMTNNVRGQRSEVRGQRSEVRGQRSEVRGQRSEVRGQRSEVRGQRSKKGVIFDNSLINYLLGKLKWLLLTTTMQQMQRRM